jgi:hypothetical protein
VLDLHKEAHGKVGVCLARVMAVFVEDGERVLEVLVRLLVFPT